MIETLSFSNAIEHLNNCYQLYSKSGQSDNILDLSEIIRQYTIAGLPMKPLCELDCIGLCQFCGKNLNKVDCTCNEGNIDSRWANLLDLVQD